MNLTQARLGRVDVRPDLPGACNSVDSCTALALFLRILISVYTAHGRVAGVKPLATVYCECLPSASPAFLTKLGEITASAVILDPHGYRNPRETRSTLIRNGTQEWIPSLISVPLSFATLSSRLR